MTRLAVTWHDGQRSGQLLVAADPQTRLRELFGSSAGPLFVNGRPVPAEATLATAGVRDGAVVGSAPVRPPVPMAPAGCLALLVASGAAAGASCQVPAGTVGRSAPLELADDEMSCRHLRIRASGGRVTVADAGSTNGTVVAGERLSAEGGNGSWRRAS